MVAGGHLWSLGVGEDGRLHRPQYFELAQAGRHLPTAGRPCDRLYPVHEVPSGLGDRLLAAATRVEELRKHFETGLCWVPEEGAFLGQHPVLGSIRISGRSFSTRPYPFLELFGWVWQHAEGLPGPLPAEAQALAQPALDAAAGWIEALKSGQLVRADSTTHLFDHAGQIFRLSALTPEAFDELLFNPHARALRLDKVVDILARSWNHPATQPTPPALLALLGQLDEEMRRPHAEILDRYLDKIRRGGTFSAGPTSDQMWTVRFATHGFVVDSNRETQEGYETVTDPIDEVTLRRRIAPVVGLTALLPPPP
jgi:hypothetical protein